MGTAAAPRLDARLVQYVAGARLGTPAAEVTRGAGELAWALGLVRPSYEQVRFLLRRLRPLAVSPTPRLRRAAVRVALDFLRVAGVVHLASGLVGLPRPATHPLARRLTRWRRRTDGPS